MNERRDIAISVPATGEAEWRATRECFETGWLTQGPKVAAFEKAFAERHNVRHALAVTSGTTALHLILAGMGVGPGDEVIVPAFTWVASANAVAYCGATPIFADIDPVTFNLAPAGLKEKITPQTRAIIAVHLFGRPAEMDAIAEAAGEIPIVEDAACAAGAEYNGRPVGTLGAAAGFSFHPRKSITTGEGGMVTTNNDALSDVMAKLRNHGAELSDAQRLEGPKPYLLPAFDRLGFNYRMTDIQGAVGLVQLEKLDEFIRQRVRWAEMYRRELSELEWLRCPTEPENGRCAWQAYVTWVDEAAAPAGRNEIMDRLKQMGVATRPGTHAVHALGVYRQQGWRPEDCPNAWAADQQSMAIPLHNRMTDEDVTYVINALKSLA